MLLSRIARGTEWAKLPQKGNQNMGKGGKPEQSAGRFPHAGQASEGQASPERDPGTTGTQGSHLPCIHTLHGSGDNTRTISTKSVTTVQKIQPLHHSLTNVDLSLGVTVVKPVQLQHVGTRASPTTNPTPEKNGMLHMRAQIWPKATEGEGASHWSKANSFSKSRRFLSLACSCLTATSFP